MFKSFYRIIVAGILAILLLSPFTALYSYDGAHRTNETYATDAVWYPSQWKGTMSEGISFMHLDEDGFNNQIVPSSVDILLMGSSHMEAFQVAKTQNTGVLLNQYLPEYTTYNIGISGHTIYHCVDNLDSALQTYTPSKYVIIETDTIALDEAQIQDALAHTRKRLRSSRGGSYYLSRYVPSANTFLQKLRNWKSLNAGSFHSQYRAYNNSTDSTTTTDASKYQYAVDTFLEYANGIVSSYDCQLIIFYHPPVSISENGQMLDETDLYYLSIFENACQKSNIIFVDMSTEFIQAYDTEHVLPYGFVNTSLGTGHLNKYGHEMIADKLAQIIKTDCQ